MPRVFLFFLLIKSVFAQVDVGYHQHIAPVIMQHCGKCHNTDSGNPVQLNTYMTVSKKADFILHVIENKVMPPWPPNPEYRSFHNENIVSAASVELIKKWIEQGKAEGVAQPMLSRHKEVKINVDNNYQVLSMPSRINVPARENDVFLRFHVPDTIREDFYVSRFEFLPGNKKILHHSEVFMDTTGSMMIDYSKNKNWQIEGDKYESKKDELFHYRYLTGWLPGEKYEEFPSGIAAKITAKANFIFLIHYAPYPVMESDSSVFIMHITREKNLREYATFSLHGHSDVQGERFFIPAGQKVTLHASKTIEEDLSAFAVLAHAHHLARAMKAYCITPQQDTIPLLLIDNWDFNWQFLYKFRNYEKLPAGSVVHFFVAYDNTTDNPENPNNPPKDVSYSFDADQEMMEFFIYHVPYRDGDELLKIEYPDDSY